MNRSILIILLAAVITSGICLTQAEEQAPHGNRTGTGVGGSRLGSGHTSSAFRWDGSS